MSDAVVPLMCGALRTIVRDADVVLATCVGAASKTLAAALADDGSIAFRGFGLVVIDEAAQVQSLNPAVPRGCRD